MNIPGFAVEASLYKSVNNYSRRGAFGQYGKTPGIVAMARIRIQPLPCPLICERVFENGVTVERCRFECLADGDGDGDSCLANCKNRGGSDEFCEQMYMAES